MARKSTAKEERAIDHYAERYMEFLAKVKTTRDVIDYVEELADLRGWKEGDPNYFRKIVDEDRSNIALIRGRSTPIRIIGSHGDAPCLHLKNHPLKEGPLGVRLDSQYYGGILAHQWNDLQVEVKGHVVKRGKEIPISLDGVIIDIAPHINRIGGKKYSDAFKAEDLDIITGFQTKEELLNKLGIEERDFARAELYVVPKQDPLMLNNNLICAYGHDDRSSVFASLEAFNCEERKTDTTEIVFITDREEIGSTGYSGAQGAFFERVLDKTQGGLEYMKKMLRYSMMLSADVTIGSTFRNAGLIDAENNANIGKGPVISSYCGSGGKYHGNQVSARMMDKLMNMFDDNEITYQISSLPSKVDGGGGGTIAMYFAQRGVPTADFGVPVAAMHSKNEVIHKDDLYHTIKAMEVFLRSKK